MALDNLRGGTKRVVEVSEPLNNLRGGTKRVVIVDGGGGGVDTSKVVNADVLPTADASSAGKYYLYTGATTAEYTQNYIYKNVKTATYTGTVSFEPATLSGTTVACSGDNFANFLTESRVEPLSVVSGTMTYDSASALWRLVGKDSDGNTVLTFQEYQQDFVDAGFTFTGTPQDGDVVSFTCTVEEASATYAWTRVDVQPAPEAIKVNTTATLAVADWSSNTQTVTVSGVKADSVVFVSPDPTSASDYASAGILCTSQGADSLTFTATTTPSVAIVVNVVCL